MDELKALADQCICHPASRGIADIEAAGEGLKDLIAKLEAAEAAVKHARIDALVSAQQAAMALGNSCSLNAVRAAIESLKEAP